MGKIIVKNIKGLGWKTRIGLIAVLTLVFSVFIYQGLQQGRLAHAAVAAGTAWSNINATAPGTPLNAGTNVNTTSAATYTAAAGSNRLLLVAVYYELGTASTATFSVTFGGVTVNPIATTGGTSNREHVWLGYVLNANIPATASTVISGITCATASTLSSVSIKAATYTGVDQVSPTTGSNANIAAGLTVASNAAVNYVTGGITVVANANGGAPATDTYTATPTLTPVAAADNTTNHSTYIAQSAVHTTTGNYASGGISITYSGTTSTRSALAVAALRPASTTTLANGLAGTTGNVAPGAANQKIDGFSLQNDSGTNGVTGLTVTSTNQAAIASMSIWNEAGTTQYFSTVNNPGSNIWAFSGGTNSTIPVSTTLANYKILVTYKNRAASPAGNTTTSANVTALTTVNATAGADTSDTTLTLLNTYAASTWRTNTAGDAKVTLNWSYGTPGQSVIIIRYAGTNTDTTKPIDGNMYAQGTSFGSGGIVAYNGSLATSIDQPLVNGTTYYYKIFEYNAVNFYYNATDVWTTGLTPASLDTVAPTVDAGFAATTPTRNLSIPITAFSATDNPGGSNIAGYLITTNSTKPLAGAAGWTASAPATYTVAADGSYTLYPWAKDGANNVSSAYALPVTVVVDRVAPSVITFTTDVSPIASRTIPITDFTASDDSSGVASYLITTNSTPPLAGAAGWAATAPLTYTVPSDGSFDLYPWAKDNAGNVSAVAPKQTVLFDTSAPTGLALISPADGVIDLPVSVTLQTSTATDPAGGVGGVEYNFQISKSGGGWTGSSGWQAGTSYSLTLTQGWTYIWQVTARDGLGNMSAPTTPRTLTIQAPCVRNAPTLTLLSGSGGTTGKITADAGTVPYTLTTINNDVGSCGSTTFNLTVADGNDLYGAFVTPSTLNSTSVTLNPGAQVSRTLTVKAQAEVISGSMRTTVSTSADANHPAVTSQYVQTVLNVVGCTARTPLLVVGPDSAYVARGGSQSYTVTVKNADAGTGCSPITYYLSPSDSNSTDFNTSTVSVPSISLSAGELGSITLVVSAKTAAVKNNSNNTTLSLTSDAFHLNPQPKIVKSTVNNPMLHNSDNLASTRWGGWGLPGMKYGEIDCTTCHVTGEMSTKNIKRVREVIVTPDVSKGTLPGNNKPIVFNRYSAKNRIRGVFGWDASPATPRTSSTKICEVCHTYDSKKVNGVNAHPYSSYSAGVAKTLGNHFSTDGTDCIKCHKHNKGFGVGGGACITCHGDDTATTLTPATDYLIAPPQKAYGGLGTITKPSSQVNNNPKIGAHQTHLRYFNGFSNFTTVDGRCSYCHGTLPTNYNHINGSSSPTFQGLARKGGLTPSFSAANLTCTNTYCHNPAASTVFKNPTNTGSKVFPSWTTASYVVNAAKSIANCNVCHKVPGVAGFEPAGAHSGMNTDTQDCSGCHGHNGNTAGKAGQRHMDGYLFGSGNCDSCHSYDTVAGAWAFGSTNYGGKNEGIGAHAKHINYIKARWGGLILNAATDKFGLGNAAAVCGVCHTNVDSNHSMGDSTQARTIDFAGSTVRKYGTINPIYNGSFNTSSGTNPKTCANIDCHYKQTPVWSTY